MFVFYLRKKDINWPLFTLIRFINDIFLNFLLCIVNDVFSGKFCVFTQMLVSFVIIYKAEAALIFTPEVLELERISQSSPSPVHCVLTHLVYSQLENTLGPGLGHLLPTGHLHLHPGGGVCYPLLPPLGFIIINLKWNITPLTLPFPPVQSPSRTLTSVSDFLSRHVFYL